jgi:SWIRM domain/Myb-like DNA-binding domain
MADIIVTLQKEEHGYSVVQESGYSLHFPYVPLYKTLIPAIVPSCASWFDPLCIHQIEVDALPEYFNEKYPSKTPQVYKTYRNFIIKLYRDKPAFYLTATQCRRVLTGDACSIIRLHAFLEHWGIINLFSEKPYSTPSYDFAWPGHMSYGRKRIFELGRPFCQSCGNICGVTWMTDNKLILCNECYESGDFPPPTDMENFTQENLLTSFNYSDIVKSEDWDENSTAELIKYLKVHGEDWDKIAEALHRQKADVINKYLTLPIQDLIEAENENFTDYDNPIPDNKNLSIGTSIDIDIENAMENSKIARRNEEIEIDRILNQMIEIQCKKIEIKSRYITEMKSLLQMQINNSKLKLQHLVNQQNIIALSKNK